MNSLFQLRSPVLFLQHYFGIAHRRYRFLLCLGGLCLLLFRHSRRATLIHGDPGTVSELARLVSSTILSLSTLQTEPLVPCLLLHIESLLSVVTTLNVEERSELAFLLV